MGCCFSDQNKETGVTDVFLDKKLLSPENWNSLVVPGAEKEHDCPNKSVKPLYPG